MQLQIVHDKRSLWDVIILKGSLDEHAEPQLEQISKDLGLHIIINFRQVERINSCGTNLWIRFMKSLGQKRIVAFEECTPEIVGQINMVSDFRGSALVQSVYAPYCCKTCDSNILVLFEKGINLPKTSSSQVPSPDCLRCGHPLESAEIMDEFFTWVDEVAS